LSSLVYVSSSSYSYPVKGNGIIPSIFVPIREISKEEWQGKERRGVVGFAREKTVIV